MYVDHFATIVVEVDIVGVFDHDLVLIFQLISTLFCALALRFNITVASQSGTVGTEAITSFSVAHNVPELEKRCLP